MAHRPRAEATQATVRRLTAGAAVGAVALTAVLSMQAGSAGLGGVQDAIVSFVGAVFPGGGLRSAPPPAPAPGATPVAVTGGS
jgi:hypothetical protein